MVSFYFLRLDLVRGFELPNVIGIKYRVSLLQDFQVFDSI